MTIGAAQQFFLGASKATGGGAAGYQIERSLRFSSNDSAYLSRTPASAGNRRIWTWAAWVKLATLSAGQNVIFSATDGTTPFAISAQSSGQLLFGSLSFAWKETTAVFRDYSAWYHFCVAVDTNQALNANRLRFYVNGVEQTAFSTNRDLYLNTDLAINGQFAHEIGRYSAGSNQYFNGYLADIHFIDGQALDPSSFTEVSATTGQLIPKAYTGTFGTNGFWLKFSDNSNNTAATLGKDYSPNGNNWTPFNLQTTTGGPTSVAAASGALPIYNTTDTYGATKGSGTRTDSNSSSIVLAIPMDGANNGTTFTDESATIKGSGSAKSITVIGNTKTVTAQSKYYGSSGYFDGAGDYLQIASTADLTVGTGAFTAECWVYPLAQSGILFQNYDNANGGWSLRIQDLGNAINGVSNNGPIIGFTSGTLPTSKWSHIAAVWSATGSNCSVYVNGVLARTISNIPSSTQDTFWIGAQGDQGPGAFFFGYLQDLRVYKGVAKYTSNFNPPTATQIPSVAAGNDSLVDTPTSYGTDTGAGGEVRGNYCTWNPLENQVTLANGNLDVDHTTASWASCKSTIGGASGKWYFEYTVNSGSSNQIIGVFQTSAALPAVGATGYMTNSASGWGYQLDGNKSNANSFTATGTTAAAGDVLMVAFDVDAGKIWFGKNGTWIGSGAPASGTNAAFANLSGSISPAVSIYGTQNGSANFGQRPFAYTAPSGFKALCDTNLTAPVVAKPNTVMDVKLITANNSTQVITGLAFSPDLVWTKSRSNSFSHYLYDTVRGVQKPLISNTTNAEATIPTSLTSFNSDGFTLGADDGANYSSGSGVAWAWDAGSSTASNPDGSITSSCRTNQSSGFSVVTYSGTLSAVGSATVGHGLNVAPAMIISKSRNNSGADNGKWQIRHIGLSSWAHTLAFDTAQAFSQSGNGTLGAPTSTVFDTNYSVGINVSGNNYVAYCFAPVVGYSSFGSYTGNGSSDGPFVYTGFRPRFLMIKRSDASQDWIILDAARNAYNVCDAILYPNASYNELYAGLTDFTSNGFKHRFAGTTQNTSGGTYIYAAFAENPFQYARAR